MKQNTFETGVLRQVFVDFSDALTRFAASFPARAPSVDPRTKAGAFGEQVRGPHKPTLDEMGPHAMLPPRGGAQPQKPTLTREVEDAGDKRRRRGRPRKTGRPGQ